MATPRSTRRPPAVAGRAALVLLGLAGMAIGALPAQAAPVTPAAQPATAADAAAMMAARAHDLEKLTEAFDAARDQLAAQQASARAAQAALEQARAAQAAAQQEVRSIARSAYTGDTGAFQALLTSHSAADFVGQVTTLQSIGTHQALVLDQATAAGRAAAQAQSRASAAVGQARATFDAVLAQQASLQKQIDGYQAAFDRLDAQEKQAAIAAASDGAATAQHASRSDVRTGPVSPGGGSGPAPAPVGPVAAPSRVGQIAVQTALAQRGKPYVWAASGPMSFDCSGLTQFAFRAAGVALPHSSLEQSQMGTPVARSQLQPGDLVFFYSPVSHVGIYVGNGQMVHAPTSGDVVKITDIDVMGAYAGARRLG